MKSATLVKTRTKHSVFCFALIPLEKTSIYSSREIKEQTRLLIFGYATSL